MEVEVGRRRRESLTGMYTKCNHGDRLSTQSGGLLRYYGNKPPLHQSRQCIPLLWLVESEHWNQVATNRSLNKIMNHIQTHFFTIYITNKYYYLSFLRLFDSRLKGIFQPGPYCLMFLCLTD